MPCPQKKGTTWAHMCYTVYIECTTIRARTANKGYRNLTYLWFLQWFGIKAVRVWFCTHLSVQYGTSLILSPGLSDTTAGPPYTYVHHGVLHWQFRPSEIENKRHDIDWASLLLVFLLSPNYKCVSVSPSPIHTFLPNARKPRVTCAICSYISTRLLLSQALYVTSSFCFQW